MDSKKENKRKMIKEEIKKELEKEGTKGRKEMEKKYKKIVKKYRLKENVKESIKAVVICSICLIFMILILSKLDGYNKSRAIETCNGKDNIIIKYDKSGDKFYQCKNEK